MQTVGPLSPEDLLTDQSRLKQPMPTEGVKWLAWALGHVCDTSPSHWTDSSGTVGPHGRGRIVKLLYWSGD